MCILEEEKLKAILPKLQFNLDMEGGYSCTDKMRAGLKHTERLFEMFT